jgi:hypothetical protein
MWIIACPGRLQPSQNRRLFGNDRAASRRTVKFNYFSV